MVCFLDTKLTCLLLLFGYSLFELGFFCLLLLKSLLYAVFDRCFTSEL